jgi:hypothetical protein
VLGHCLNTTLAQCVETMTEALRTIEDRDRRSPFTFFDGTVKYGRNFPRLSSAQSVVGAMGQSRSVLAIATREVRTRLQTLYNTLWMLWAHRRPVGIC